MTPNVKNKKCCTNNSECCQTGCDDCPVEYSKKVASNVPPESLDHWCSQENEPPEIYDGDIPEELDL